MTMQIFLWPEIVCYDESEDKLWMIAHDLWPIAGMPEFKLGTCITRYFEDVAKLVTPEQISKKSFRARSRKTILMPLKNFQTKVLITYKLHR
jgi:hypothetical protein